MDRCDYIDNLKKKYDELKCLIFDSNTLLKKDITNDEIKMFALTNTYLKSLNDFYSMFDSLDGIKKEFFINENYLTNLFIKRITDYYNNGEIDKVMFLLRKESLRIKVIIYNLNHNMMNNYTSQKRAIDTLREYKKDFYKISGKSFKNNELHLNDYDVECISSMVNSKEKLEITNRDELERKFIGL